MLSYNQLRVLTGALSVSNAVLCLTGIRAIKVINEQHDRVEKMCNITKYLVHLLEEHDVPLTEFDVIALSDLGALMVDKEDSTN